MMQAFSIEIPDGETCRTSDGRCCVFISDDLHNATIETVDEEGRKHYKREAVWDLWCQVFGMEKEDGPEYLKSINGHPVKCEACKRMLKEGKVKEYML